MTELEQLAEQLISIRDTFFVEGCDRCPFYSMEDISEEIQNGSEPDTNYCDSVPIHCKFWTLADLCNACDAYEKRKGKKNESA